MKGKDMTIDEYIESARNIAKEQRYYANFEKGMMHSVCINTAENNEQIAEWLEELKEARKGFEENRKAGYKHGYSDGYAKAIDEFAEAIRGICYKCPIGTDADTNEPLYGHEDGTWHNLIDDVAEQMKAGAV